MPSRKEVTGTSALSFIRHLSEALDGNSAMANQLFISIGEPWHEHHPLARLKHLHDPQDGHWFDRVRSKANFHRPRSMAAQSHASIILHSNAGRRSVVPHAPVPIDNLSHAAIPHIGSARITNRAVSERPALADSLGLLHGRPF